MGSKGSNTTSTTQQQTYNPAGAGYIQNALNTAQNAAGTPFQQPAAPVAGFSQDQQNAFNTVNGAQGMAQPYINTAANYFSPQGAQAFYNPYASAVTAQMNNIFGQQQQQATGQLTQAAGGVGADRIAVGQSELANQQGLAAGQTFTNLYGQAGQMAQGAGYGTAALGSEAQNTALSGAQAQLGTGGLQQQLSQAQLNSPYQLQLAKLAYPFQTSQFLSSATGALAPGLGGTTSGTGTSTGPAPSMLSQILGLGTAAVGAAGGAGAFGGGSKGSGNWQSPGNAIPGASGPTSVGGSAGPTPLNYARGGDVGYEEGGAAENPYQLPPNFNDKPINVDQQSIIPTGQIPQIKAQMPSLNLNPPAPSGGSSGAGDAGKAIGTAIQIAGMFLKRGGKVDPKKFDGANPYAFASGGSTFNERFTGGDDSDVVNPDEPFRMPDQAAVDDWRRGTPAPTAFAGSDSTPAFPPPRGAHARSVGAPVSDPDAEAAPTVNPYSAPAADPQDRVPARDTGFAGSPWSALMAAGLATAAGTSPFALTNIGAGGLQGLKTLEGQRAASQKDETIDQATKRLTQEAKFHEDQYSRMTPYQKANVEMAQREASYKEMQPVKIGVDALGRDIMARKDPKSGQYINAVTGKPVEDPSLQFAPKYNIPGAQAENDPGALPPHARVTQGVNVPEGVNPEILAQLPPQRAATIRAIDEGRQSLTSVPLRDRQALIDQLNAYDPSFDQSTWTLRNQQQREMSTNGNAGKMILAVNQLLPHLKTASDKAQELENSNYPAANTIKNWWATATGDPAVKKFETVREVAAMDAARLLRGSGAMAEQDIDFWRKNLASAGSPAQLQENLKLLADDLMGARISSIQHSYRTNMRMEPPDFVSKEAKEALMAIKARNGGPSAATAPAPAAAGPAASPAAPAAAAKPPTVTQNGHVYNLQPDGSYK